MALFGANYFGGPYFAQAYLLVITADGHISKIYLTGSSVQTISLSGSNVALIALVGTYVPELALTGTVENHED